jgi:hypothetical protein
MKEQEYFVEKFLKGLEETPTPTNFKPCKITFFLSSPLSLTHPWLHFDGVVSYLQMRKTLKEDFFLLSRKTRYTFPLHKKFPIAYYKNIPCASVSILESSKYKLEVMYKRFEDRWAGGKRKVYRGSGAFRDFMLQHLYVPTRTVVFYAKADLEILKDLLKDLIGLGDNWRIGWGAMRDFVIEEMEEDWSIVANGVAMRPIPTAFLKSCEDTALLAWKPPYWDTSNVEECAVPGSRVEFKDE